MRKSQSQTFKLSLSFREKLVNYWDEFSTLRLYRCALASGKKKHDRHDDILGVATSLPVARGAGRHWKFEMKPEVKPLKVKNEKVAI